MELTREQVEIYCNDLALVGHKTKAGFILAHDQAQREKLAAYEGGGVLHGLLVEQAHTIRSQAAHLAAVEKERDRFKEGLDTLRLKEYEGLAQQLGMNEQGQDYVMTCTCAAIPPTMPTCRDKHLASCPVALAQRVASLEAAIKAVQPDVCSYLCPSVKRGDGPWPHTAKCQAVTQALAPVADQHKETT